jgi:hypothetical protein
MYERAELDGVAIGIATRDASIGALIKKVETMAEIGRERTDENVLQFDVCNEALECAAGTQRAVTITQWICTALYFCPGP